MSKETGFLILAKGEELDSFMKKIQTNNNIEYILKPSWPLVLASGYTIDIWRRLKSKFKAGVIDDKLMREFKYETGKIFRRHGYTVGRLDAKSIASYYIVWPNERRDILYGRSFYDSSDMAEAKEIRKIVYSKDVLMATFSRDYGVSNAAELARQRDRYFMMSNYVNNKDFLLTCRGLPATLAEYSHITGWKTDDPDVLELCCGKYHRDLARKGWFNRNKFIIDYEYSHAVIQKSYRRT